MTPSLHAKNVVLTQFRLLQQKPPLGREKRTVLDCRVSVQRAMVTARRLATPFSISLGACL
jgi:hypothetical protein